MHELGLWWMLLTGTWQLHSGYSTGESDFSSSTNSSLPLAPQTGPEHREPLSCLWCNVDGFILCQSHSDKPELPNCVTAILQPDKSFPQYSSTFSTSPLFCPPPLPQYSRGMKETCKSQALGTKWLHEHGSLFLPHKNAERLAHFQAEAETWLRGRCESERKVMPGQGLCLEMGTIPLR